jgi:ABC-type multidrug transport system ATPase subunit
MKDSSPTTRLFQTNGMSDYTAFSNFGLYWNLMWTLRIRQKASYFLMTYVVPLIFVLIIQLIPIVSIIDLADYPIPNTTQINDSRIILSMYNESIVVTPDTEYLRSLFTELIIPDATIAFLPSRKAVAESLMKEYENGFGFSLSGEKPFFNSNWSVVVLDETMSDSFLMWTDAARAICDQAMNSTYRYSSRTFAHPAMQLKESSTSPVGYLLALPFVTVGLMKGLLLSINLQELRVSFLLTLNGVSEICQPIVSLLISLIESLPILTIGSIVFLVVKTFSSSNPVIFVLAYLIAVISYLFFTSAVVTILHSRKAFGIYLALGIIIETGINLIVDFGDHFPPGVLVFIETLFPFGNFIALISHALRYNGLQWGNLNLTVSGLSGSVQFACVWINMLLNCIFCILFNMCNSRPFGSAPIGWQNIFKLSVWKAFFQRRGHVEFNNIEIEGIRKVYDGKIVAVDHVDLSIKQGECILCVGANGAGKSTLLEMLCGARKPTSGIINACGSNIFVDTRAYHAILSIVFQDNALIPNYTAREHIVLFSRLAGRTEDEVREIVDTFNSMFKMRDFINNFSENLSGGSKRKLCLAIALAKNPQVFVCDEPCAGIDVEARQMIWRAISSYPGMTSFINVHSIDEAESMTSRILVMSQGRAKFCGTPAEMREEFKCGYEITILDDSASIENILSNVREIVPEVHLGTEHERTLMLPADLRVGAALEAIGDVNYIVHLDSVEITIRKMIEDDEVQAKPT